MVNSVAFCKAKTHISGCFDEEEEHLDHLNSVLLNWDWEGIS